MQVQHNTASVSKKVINSDWIKDVLSGATDLLKVFENIIEQDTIVGSSIGVLAEGFKDLSKSLKDITGNDGVAKLIKLFITYKNYLLLQQHLILHPIIHLLPHQLLRIHLLLSVNH